MHLCVEREENSFHFRMNVTQSCRMVLFMITNYQILAFF